MFGSKFRTWMEAHIARAKHKKKDRNKKEDDNLDSACNSPLVTQRQNGTTSLSAKLRVHPTAPLTPQSANKVEQGIGSGTRITSNAGGCGNLSSPESAYSTGYSTDSTSPGATFPPEYYINIRTGTHYFQNGGSSRSSSSSYSNSNNNNNNNDNHHTKANNRDRHGVGKARNVGQVFDTRTGIECAASNGLSPYLGRQQPFSHQYHHHQQPQQQQRRSHSAYSGDMPSSNPAAGVYCHAELYSSPEVPALIPSRPLILPSPPCTPSTQSPRQRSRIRTNPWLSANSSCCNTPPTSATSVPTSCTVGSSTKILCRNEINPVVNTNITHSGCGSANNVNVNLSWRPETGMADLDHRQIGRSYRQESLSAGRSPINSKWTVSSRMDLGRKPLSSTSSNSSTSGRSINSNSRHSALSTSLRKSGQHTSEDDITMNEMMGKYDESYIYDKETDILSDDSERTDCEDRIDDLTDGRCSYSADVSTMSTNSRRYTPDKMRDEDFFLNNPGQHNITNHLNNNGGTVIINRRRRKSKNRDDEGRRLIGKRVDGPTYTKRQTNIRNHYKGKFKDKENELFGTEEEDDEEEANQKLLKSIALGQATNTNFTTRNRAISANMNHILVERLLLKNNGFNQASIAPGSRSAGGTPTFLRRKKLQGINDAKNRSSLTKLTNVDREPLRIGHPASPTPNDENYKRRSNSISYAMHAENLRLGLNRRERIFASDLALMEADKEADRKYRELILEAESILINMQQEELLDRQNSLPVAPSPSRRVQNCLTNRRVEHIKNTELHIELALSKSRNLHPELASGSIKDLEHASPKRQQLTRSIANPASPIRAIQRENDTSAPNHRDYLPRDISIKQELQEKLHSPILANRNQQRRDQSLDRKVGNGLREENDNNERIRDSTELAKKPYEKLKRETHFPTFRSINMGPSRRTATEKREGVAMNGIGSPNCYCPQSEPVKRKVYAGSVTYGRIQQTLAEQRLSWLRNSDSDSTNDQESRFGDADSQSRHSLGDRSIYDRRFSRESNEIAVLNQALSSSQLRRQMLVQTLQGLKQSLRDQSDVLKQTCLKPTLLP